MNKEPMEELVLFAIFFPLMELKKSFNLCFGKIGPLSLLKSEYSLLNKLLPILSRNMVNNQNIEDPVVGVATINPAKLIEEIECITFFACSSSKDRAEDEILGQKYFFTIYQKENRLYCDLDGHAGCELEFFHKCSFQYFPRSFTPWDRESIDDFENFLTETLENDFYNALVACLSEVNDEGEKKDRTRILVAVKLFNEAFIRPTVASLQTYSQSYIVLIGGAFEALLNLPRENINKAFQHTVMLLVGNRSSALKKWCSNFYEYRSRLAHGDIHWSQEEEIFNLNGENLQYSIIASRLFIYCLKTKLFLMGLFSNYRREMFNIK